jgi:hypothetical protein
MQGMKVDLTDKVIYDLDGSVITEPNQNGGERPVTHSRIISRVLAYGSQKSADPVEDFDIATRLYKDGVVDVSESTVERIEKMIQDAERYAPIAKAQIIRELRTQRLKASDEAAKERAKKKS